MISRDIYAVHDRCSKIGKMFKISMFTFGVFPDFDTFTSIYNYKPRWRSTRSWSTRVLTFDIEQFLSHPRRTMDAIIECFAQDTPCSNRVPRDLRTV